MAGLSRHHRRRPKGLTYLVGERPSLWFKSDRWVYTDNGTTLATDTNYAQMWRDYSGNSLNVSQSNSTYKPYYQEGAIGDYPAIRSILQGFFASGVSVSNIYSVFVVGRSLRPGDGTYFSASGTTGNDYNSGGIAVRSFGIDFTTESFYSRYIYPSTPSQGYESFDKVVCATQNADGKAYQSNHTSIVTVAATRTQSNLAQIAVGARAGLTSVGFNGPSGLRFSEIILFNRVLSRDEVLQVFAYLIGKYMTDPTNVMAVQDKTSVTLTWQAASFANSYDVSYKNADSSDWIFHSNTTGLTANITGLNSATTYQFKVQSVWSNAW